MSVPAELMLSLLPKPRAPKPQSFLWDECQSDTVPETSPALPGLVLSRVKCLGNWDVDPTVPYATSQLRSSSVQRYRNIYVGKATAFMPRPLCPAGKNLEFVLMEDTRFSFSPGLITKAVKIDPALLFTAFRGLCSGLVEKLKFCLLSPDLN